MHRLSAHQLHRHFCQHALSAQEIVAHLIARIQQHDPKIQAFLEVYSDDLLQQAAALDAKRKQGKQLGKLAAVPIAIKDNIHIAGKKTTCGSKFLANYHALFDATAIQRLKAEDALLIGKTNLDEFGMGSSTENSAFQQTRNPWDLSCTPGGSSGGSAAAVSARLCPLALGSDTGGSIRQPAAMTGIIGYKPTYGRISRYGLVAYGSSLDQIGPFATTVADIALLLEVIATPCSNDPTSIPTPPPPFSSALNNRPTSFTVGISWPFLEQLQPAAKKLFQHALNKLEQAGARCIEVDLEMLKHSLSTYYILSTAEAATNLARFSGIHLGQRCQEGQTIEQAYSLSRQQGFGAEVKRRILLGTYVLSAGYQNAYYKKAQQVRTLIANAFQTAFTHCDVIALPTTPSTAFPLGTIQEPLEMYLQDIYTLGASLAGLPAITLPAGHSEEGKPFGLQLLSQQRQDHHLLAIAQAFEAVHSEHHHLPPQFA